MIEAFDEVMNDQTAVEDCRVWLLKQKQTQDWKTTKATADAVYSLLLRGRNILSSDALVEVSLAGKSITPSGGSPSPRGEGRHAAPKSDGGGGEGKQSNQPTPKIEPGTGFYEVRFTPSEIKPKL